MKYYTLAEHHIFCVESGIPGVDVWREVAKLGWLPEGIFHKPDNAFNPERKEYQKEYNKNYTSTPEYKARRKKYRSTPEHKANRKEIDRKYRSTPEHKAWRKEYDKRRYRRNKK